MLRRLPRIGLYAPWSGFKPEGWMRWVLDTWRIPYRTVRNEDLRAGSLDEIVDVLLLPGNSSSQLDGGRAEGSIMPRYAGGLDPEGAIAVEEFVRGGGRLVTCGASSAWAIDLLRLPLVDVTTEADDFSCPGSVLRTVPETSTWTRGLPASVGVFFSRSAAWRVLSEREQEEAGTASDGRLEVLLRFAPSRVLLSGWIQGSEALAGQAAWVRARHGKGSVHLLASVRSTAVGPSRRSACSSARSSSEARAGERLRDLVTEASSRRPPPSNAPVGLGSGERGGVIARVPVEPLLPSAGVLSAGPRRMCSTLRALGVPAGGTASARGPAAARGAQPGDGCTRARVDDPLPGRRARRTGGPRAAVVAGWDPSRGAPLERRRARRALAQLAPLGPARDGAPAR